MPLLKPTRGILLNKNHPLARGLVGCWLMNEGTGLKVHDLSGNQARYLGDFKNNVSWVAGKSGRALYFDGTNDIVKLQIWDGGTKVTLFARVKFEEAIGNIEQIVTADSYQNGLRTFHFRRSDAGKLQFVVFVGNVAKTITGNTTLTSGVWWSVVGVNDGTNSHIFVNGLEDATPVATGNMDTDATAWAIGGRANSTDWADAYILEDLQGSVEFLMRWDKALSASEIVLLYRVPFCMFERAIRLGLIGGPIVNLAGASAALSSLSATAKAIRKVGGTVASTSAVTAQLSSIRGEESLLGIERSWLREALFNSMTANAYKLGTTLSLGWFWIRVAGCSVLYRGPSMELIDFTNILTVAEQNACEISPPIYLPHNCSSTYFYVIRRFSNCGYQENTLAAAAKVSIDAGGELRKPQPNNIFSSRAEQVDGNKIQLVWFYCPLEQKSQPVRFNVYYDGGMGQVDYETPLAKVNYEGRRFYSYQTGALSAGGYLFTIRAEDADGIENSSLSQLKIQLDTTNPDAIDILSTETV